MTEDTGKRVLVVDDNKSVLKVVSDHLKSIGYIVSEAQDGIQGLNLALSAEFDVIILDVVIPGLDGFKVCEFIREKGYQTPIIMLTEKSAIEDKIAGFSLGADDFLGKPFSPLELELRIKALIRRAGGDTAPAERNLIKHGGLEIDLDKHEVRIEGKEIALTPIEFNILKMLAAAPGRVFSREDLLNVIWDTDYTGYKRNIDPHVTRLRLKIEQNPRKPKYILTVWGFGYKFNESFNG